jgi:hypothetical protein
MVSASLSLRPLCSAVAVWARMGEILAVRNREREIERKRERERERERERVRE